MKHRLFSNPDLVLVHAPSVYDFRKRNVLYGPVSDVVPSTQVFEMYPIGFLTMLTYLEARGLRVRIANVALRMLRSRRFDAERFLRKLRPAAFGFDLHWMVHAQGSLELARLAKQAHPDVPVIFGGLSASYYHEELIRYPQVDYVLRGDSVEEPLCRLMRTIQTDGDPAEIPNLVWKDSAGVHVNSLTHVPSDLDAVSFDYRKIMAGCVRYLDFFGHLPFKMWLRYPILAALSVRGCVHNCAICGGSAAAYRRIFGRATPAYRDPELLAREMGTIARYVKGPIIILGDLLQAGAEHADRFLHALKRQRIANHIAFEFFFPPTREFLEAAAEAVPRFNIQMSPESHDERVRRAFGRAYDNATLERSVRDAFECGCRRFDVFFMIGIPEQTTESVRATIAYCAELMRRSRAQGHGGKLHPYISPLAPFLDPGSEAFENPERHGYRLFCRTLEEHRQALLAPSWKHTLNYETQWMRRDALVDVTYEAALALNALKAEEGLLSAREARVINERIARERELIGAIDQAMRIEDRAVREQNIAALMRSFQTTGPSTICKKDEMNWPAALVRFNPFRVLRAALGRGGVDGG